MNLDPVFLRIVESGGVSGLMIAGALIYLAMQVRALQHSVDLMQKTIGEKVFPRLDDHTDRIGTLEGRFATWETMRKSGE
ncbi:MAG: hypothetical protein A3E78_01890 [Alphaproteobacteria bacterium RIFCSPHIGHO2_12_FULL_63_12]|nr:MAG: hypothetical protein A3E78_01890 [Alphaproteobacteria bacterium RIFCSPHIGHO2_12_FULL_63_12]